MKEYAYIRVSSKDQQDGRQFIAMESRGIPLERIFSEKQSGKDTKRSELQALMDTVKNGDTIVVESISRFARNTRDLTSLNYTPAIELVCKLLGRDVSICPICGFQNASARGLAPPLAS